MPNHTAKGLRLTELGLPLEQPHPCCCKRSVCRRGGCVPSPGPGRGSWARFAFGLLDQARGANPPRAGPRASCPPWEPGQHQQHPPLQLTSKAGCSPSKNPSFPPFLPSLWRGGFGVRSRGSPQSAEVGEGPLALSPISSPCTRGAGGTEGTEAMPSTCQAHSSLSWAPGGSAGDKTSPFLCWSEPNAFKLPLHLSLWILLGFS